MGFNIYLENDVNKNVASADIRSVMENPVSS